MGSVYKSKKWRNFEPKDRAYLIPTMEDVRPGSLVSISSILKPSLEYCLSEKGVKYKEDKEGLIIVYKDESLIDYILMVRNKFKENKGFYPSVFGKKLFGYPECCVDNFVDRLVFDGIPPGTEWKKKAREALEKGVFNELFYYTFHVPHDLGCQESLKMAKEIKRVLESNDCEAAEYLRRFKINALGE